MNQHAGRPEPQAPGAIGPPDATAPPEQVVRRMLLRRGCVIETDTARLVVQALRTLLKAEAAARPRSRQRRRPPDQGAGCEPMF